MNKKKSHSFLLWPLLLLLSGCSSGPEEIAFGKDQCAECRMTIMDPKFGAEVVTGKGKVYKFDDAFCLARFVRSGKEPRDNISQTLFLDYANSKKFLNGKTAWFVLSPFLKSPMNGNAAALPDQTSASTLSQQVNGKLARWEDLLKTL